MLDLMKFILSLIAFAVLIPGVSCAQAVYEPGYIVTLNGDTVRGFVNDPHWVSNPDRFEFKQTMDGAVTLYKALAVQAFGVSNRTYVSAVADVEISPIETSDLETNSAFRMATDTVFLTPIFQGSKSLYYNRQGRRFYYYIGRGPSGFELLQYKKYYREATNSVAENSKFVGQLITYLDDCPGVSKRLSNTNYTQLSLEKIFQKYYYSCKHVDIRPIREVQERRAPSDPPTSELGVFVGVSMSSILFRTSNPE